jgi:hypothetical protein
MGPNAEHPETEQAYGMRGPIPGDRMQQIQSELPRSVALRDVLPCLADFFSPTTPARVRRSALVSLSHGWHMLNQARMALVEAEACRVFYEECEPNRPEALYRCGYYLDDASLRLHSSCEHMLHFVVRNWNLPKELLRSADKGTRESLLQRVLKAAKKSQDKPVRVDLANILEQLRANKEWKSCMRHRHEWVHVQVPPIKDLFRSVVTKSCDYERELPPEACECLGLKGRTGYRITFGEGTDINMLREIVRKAYGKLFHVFDEITGLIVCPQVAASESSRKEIPG